MRYNEIQNGMIITQLSLDVKWDKSIIKKTKYPKTRKVIDYGYTKTIKLYETMY